LFHKFTLTAGLHAPNKKPERQATNSVSSPPNAPIESLWLAATRRMSNSDPIITRELPVIHKIIADETWLEGERRGREVSPDDPVVRDNVCAVILRIGEQLRENFQRELSSSEQAA
jgi:hypothetical protein